MKRIVLLFPILLSLNVFGQKMDVVDSVSNEICKSIMLSQENNDSIRIFRAFNEHANSYLLKYTSTQSDSIGNKIYFRLQKTCSIFKDILVRNSPTNRYWKWVDEKPIAKLVSSECNTFFHHTNFIYFESNGDTVHLTIENNLWIDHFQDHTYSKLKMFKEGDCQFSIEFIESNNDIRKNFSNPGDKYIYTILDKNDNYFLVAVETPTLKGYSIFRLYY